MTSNNAVRNRTRVGRLIWRSQLESSWKWNKDLVDMACLFFSFFFFGFFFFNGENIYSVFNYTTWKPRSPHNMLSFCFMFFVFCFEFALMKIA